MTFDTRFNHKRIPLVLTTNLLRFEARIRRLNWMLARSAARLGKRALDLLAGSLVLVLSLPLVAVLAVLIRLDSPGPVFFRQTRVGLAGRHFELLKFRSMYQDAERRRRDLESSECMSGGIRFKIKRDPRITRVGRWLRASSLDELPQILNVLRGEMSLVGPRPPIPSEVEQYDLPTMQRLEGVPGITCIWQVSGRAEIPFEQQVEMDLDYLERQSLSLDLGLLLRTVPAVLLGRGAC